MNNRSKRPIRVRISAACAVEFLEARAYLTGVVLSTIPPLAANSVGIAPVFSNLADFNNDSKADLFVANDANATGTPDSVSVLLSNSDGTFATPDTVGVTGVPLPLATGNFTNSGNLDIVAGTTGAAGTPGDVSVILGNGNGTFNPVAVNNPALSNNQAITVGDFTNDGNQDVITVSNSASATGNAELLTGNGTGTLLPAAGSPFNLPFGSVSTIASGDFNGDGNLDFAVCNQLDNSISVFLGTGTGTFSLPMRYAAGPSPTSMVVANFTGQLLGNGMPELDIVTADSTGHEVAFLRNNGSGGFATPVFSQLPDSGPGGGPLKVRLANFTTVNSTTETDLVVLLSPGSKADADVLIGDSRGDFTVGNSISTMGGTRNAIASGNINNDTYTDVVLTNSTQVQTLLNTTSSDTSTPTAMVNLMQPNGSTLSSTYTFTVTYADTQQIDASTLSNSNLVVTFPGGNQQPATLVAGQALGNAASIAAKYQITFTSPLTIANDGSYGVTLAANSVKNAGGVAALGGGIGSFTLNVVAADVTAPTAIVGATQATPVPGALNYDFTVTYSDNVAILASTIKTGNVMVTFPGNIKTESPTLISTGLTNGANVTATYQITFSTPLTPANSGGYQVTTTSPAVTDTSLPTPNAVPAGNIGSFTLTVADTSAPTALLDVAQATLPSAATTYNFSVTYGDDVALMASTLGNTNLTVTPPGGGAPIAATLLSTGLTNLPTLDPTYQITFPSPLTVSNSGTYTVNIASNSVTDTSANAVPAGSIGTFALTVTPPPAPTGIFSVTGVTGKVPPSAVTGSKQKPGLLATVTYNGTTIVTKATVTVQLYTSSSIYHDMTAVPAGLPVIKKVGKLTPGKSFKISFKPFLYPGTVGSYYLVADVALNGTLNSYDGATASPIMVAAPFVDANALAAAPIKPTLLSNVKAAAFITVQNIGNVATAGPATVDISVVPVGGGTATVIATGVPLPLHLNAGQTKKLRVNFTPGTLPASGSYNIRVTVNLANDNNAANNTVTLTVAVTI